MSLFPTAAPWAITFRPLRGLIQGLLLFPTAAPWAIACRPLHGLIQGLVLFPTAAPWAIMFRPLRGLISLRDSGLFVPISFVGKVGATLAVARRVRMHVVVFRATARVAPTSVSLWASDSSYSYSIYYRYFAAVFLFTIRSQSLFKFRHQKGCHKAV